MSSINIERVIENYREFVNAVNEKMATVGEGVAVPTTVFAKEIAPRFDVEWSTCYQLMKFIAASDDGLEIKGGPKGGLRTIPKSKEIAVEDIAIEENKEAV